MEDSDPKLAMVECQDDAVWDGFVARSPQGSVFCASAFLAVLDARVFRYIVSRCDQVVAACVVMTRSGVAVRAPLLFTQYQGIMVSPEFYAQPWHRRSLDEQRLAGFIIQELSQKHGMVSFCLHPNWSDVRPFSWHHYGQAAENRFTIDVRYTGWLDLAGLPPRQEYMARIRNLRRRDLQKAENAGCVVASSRDIGQLDLLHDLTFKRQGIARSSEEVDLMRRIAGAALQHGFGTLLTCSVQDRVVSANLILQDNLAGYYLIGANDPEFRSTGASTLLMLECIERCAHQGLSRFDFVGLNSPQRGDYKQSFGARPVPYYIVHWSVPVG